MEFLLLPFVDVDSSGQHLNQPGQGGVIGLIRRRGSIAFYLVGADRSPRLNSGEFGLLGTTI
jgi:hypothetical protein